MEINCNNNAFIMQINCNDNTNKFHNKILINWNNIVLINDSNNSGIKLYARSIKSF